MVTVTGIVRGVGQPLLEEQQQQELTENGPGGNHVMAGRFWIWRKHAGVAGFQPFPNLGSTPCSTRNSPSLPQSLPAPQKQKFHPSHPTESHQWMYLLGNRGREGKESSSEGFGISLSLKNGMLSRPQLPTQVPT